jgi:hypothetical protein
VRRTVEDTGLPCVGESLVAVPWIAFPGERDLNGDGDPSDVLLYLYNIETRETRTVSGAVIEETEFWQMDTYSFQQGWIAYRLSEAQQSRDFNSDGDTDDTVLHLHNLQSGETANTRLQTHYLRGFSYCFRDTLLLYSCGSCDESYDLPESERWPEVEWDGRANGVCSFPARWHVVTPERGVRNDTIHVIDREIGDVYDLGLVSTVPFGGTIDGSPWYHISGKWLAVVGRARDDQDLDGRLYVHDLLTRESRNIGLRPAESTLSGAAVQMAGPWLATVSQTFYLLNIENGDNVDVGDVRVNPWSNSFAGSEKMLAFCALEAGWEFPRLFVVDLTANEMTFIRADSNADSTIDMADAIFALSYLFADGPAPPCQDAADTNDDGAVNLADGIYTLQHLFASGPAIPPPYTVCDIDPTPDALECAEYEPCRP